MKKRIIPVLLAVGLLVPLSGCTVGISNPLSAPVALTEKVGKTNPKPVDTTPASTPSDTAPAEGPATTPPVVETPVEIPLPETDLDGGSLTHTLSASDLALKINYWTEGAGDGTSINLAASSIDLSGSGRKMYLSDVQISSSFTGGGANLVNTGSPAPGYLLGAPYAYNESFFVGSVPEDVKEVTLTFRYGISVPASAKSKDFFKQTFTDSFTVPVNRS